MEGEWCWGLFLVVVEEEMVPLASRETSSVRGASGQAMIFPWGGGGRGGGEKRSGRGPVVSGIFLVLTNHTPAFRLKRD